MIMTEYRNYQKIFAINYNNLSYYEEEKLILISNREQNAFSL